MAQFDTLTELPNRALFDDRLKHAIAQAKRDGTWLALMSIDLDRFKPVNDAHGHHVGDLCYRPWAPHTGLRAPSRTASGIGGDEFFILLPVIDHAADALTVAERSAMRRPTFRAGGHANDRHLVEHRHHALSRPRRRHAPALPLRRSGDVSRQGAGDATRSRSSTRRG